MKANDVLLVALNGDGPLGEQYEVARILRVDESTGDIFLDTQLTVKDRTEAFAKARAIAAGLDVYFKQRGGPFYLQDFYNYFDCPNCGMKIAKFEETEFARAPGTSMRTCPACRQMISAPVIL